MSDLFQLIVNMLIFYTDFSYIAAIISSIIFKMEGLIYWTK